MAKKQAPPPAIAATVEFWPLDRLKAYERNARTHPPQQIAEIAASIEKFGFAGAILADAKGIVAGHGRKLGLEALFAAGKTVRMIGGLEIPAGHAPVIDCAGWSDADRRAYILADNRIAQNAGWDSDLLTLEVGELKLGGIDISQLGFSRHEVRKMTSGVNAGKTDPDATPPEPAAPVSEPGDIWVMGKHRLACGDSTQPELVGRLFSLGQADCIITDPPYCSGGFQDAGRSIGSIGGDQTKKGGKFEGGIANDRLSTRGYLALMKSVLGLSSAPMLYAFTDWRMWNNLYDVAESSGYVTRSMVVWDKGTPGMGAGWRTQHELVLFGAKQAVKFNNRLALGNVLRVKRSGNDLHPTQKPVELLRSIMSVSDQAQVIYDPFTGSGSTLIACEQEGRVFLGAELSPGFVDVAVTRWEQFTGQKAKRERKAAAA